MTRFLTLTNDRLGNGRDLKREEPMTDENTAACSSRAHLLDVLKETTDLIGMQIASQGARILDDECFEMLVVDTFELKQLGE